MTEIHELDLCYWFFGLPIAISAMAGNGSPQKLDVEDTILINAQYSDFLAQISCCFMSGTQERGLTIAGSEGWVNWDGTTHTLRYTTADNKKMTTETLQDYANDEMFVQQAQHFLRLLDQKFSFEFPGAQVIADAAKRSMVDRSCLVAIDPEN